MSEHKDRLPKLGGLERNLKRFQVGASNALELLQRGRLTAPYHADFEVAGQCRFAKLRHYHSTLALGASAVREPLLLVPPLMVTSEIYDISPELSAVSWLSSQGLDVWCVDFGKPETEEGGLDRSLADHILAVDEAITHIHQTTGRSVHVAGYSQGGMFAYQAAAYRRSKNVGSVITFGSPVNIWRNLPVKVKEDLTERVLDVASKALAKPLEQIQGLPGAITSGGFKVFNARKELRQVVGLFGLLHDREALKKREPKRRFLGGEGFVAWPGPAFREFVDQMVVQNRLSSGGLVVEGRAVSLADLTCPILYFVGSRDDLARPAAVRAIAQAAPSAQLHEQTIEAGHFGLVVGSKAMGQVWPSVHTWIRWRSGQTTRPEFLDAPANAKPQTHTARTGLLYDVATDMIDGLWHKLGDVSGEVTQVIDAMRWQLPRLTELEHLSDDSPVSIGRALAQQAQTIGQEPFFLWRGHVFTYSQADARVNQVLTALVELGVTPGSHVGVFMDNHPDYLTAVAAINRLGAVSVLVNAGMRGASLQQALKVGEVESLLVDDQHAQSAREAFDGDLVMCLAHQRQDEASLPSGVIDLEERLDLEVTQPPEGLEANPGLGSDLAMLMFTSGTTGLPKAARITNRRWAAAALGAAAACRLTARDTVYCCLPLHHATGMLVAVGGALVGGARLALAPKFSASAFWQDVHRNGVTVVFYVGELCRYLVNAPEGPVGRHPVRLFVGNGMRPGVWQRLLERFGPFQVLEFYGSTEGNAALANLTGDKIGSVGSEMGTRGRLRLVRCDPKTQEIVRNTAGTPVPCSVDEPGLLIARIDASHPLGKFDGYNTDSDTEARILRDAFEPGDAWFITGDLLRQDHEGDFWFIDRLGDTFRWKGENVSTQQVADVIESLPWINMATIYGISLPGREGRAGMAAVELVKDHDFDAQSLWDTVCADLFPAARPRFVRVVSNLETTASLKPIKHRLQAQGAEPDAVGDPVYWYDPQKETYSRLNATTFEELVTGGLPV